MSLFTKYAAAVVTSVQNGIDNALSRDSTPEPNIMYPGDNCCVFYKDAHYASTNITKCHDGVNTLQFDMRDEGLNDAVTSTMCGHAVAYDFCNDNWECVQNSGNHGAGAIRSPYVGHNNRLTFVTMKPYDAAMQGAVTFFDDPDCTGKHGVAFASEDVNAFAYYTKDELWLNGAHWDECTALMVPYGYAVDMYDTASFSGDMITVTGPYWLDQDMNMECISVQGTYNNKMASARVYRTGVYGSARGYWKSFTSTETMTFDTHYGFTSSHSEEE